MRPCCSTPSYDMLLSRSCYKLNPKLYQPDMKQKIALAHLYLKFMPHLKLQEVGTEKKDECSKEARKIKEPTGKFNKIKL